MYVKTMRDARSVTVYLLVFGVPDLHFYDYTKYLYHNTIIITTNKQNCANIKT